jgi:hypothetical protein
MHASYSVKKCREQWTISVAGTVFFRCRNRREAVLTARLASELLRVATEDGNSSLSCDPHSAGQKQVTGSQSIDALGESLLVERHRG